MLAAKNKRIETDLLPFVLCGTRSSFSYFTRTTLSQGNTLAFLAVGITIITSRRIRDKRHDDSSLLSSRSSLSYPSFVSLVPPLVTLSSHFLYLDLTMGSEFKHPVILPVRPTYLRFISTHPSILVDRITRIFKPRELKFSFDLLDISSITVFRLHSIG